MFFQADREHVLRGRGADPDPGQLVRHDPRGHLHRDKTHAHRPPLLPRQGEMKKTTRLIERTQNGGNVFEFIVLVAVTYRARLKGGPQVV